MNANQEQALRVLDGLLVTKSKRNRRGLDLLAYGGSLPEGHAPLPAGFCQGWAFALSKHFARALDISLSRRTRKIGGKFWNVATSKMDRKDEEYYAWTQGTGFYFAEGYTVTASDGSCLLQVERAKPASGAQPRNRDEDDADGGRAVEVEQVIARRDPGLAEVLFYRSGNEPGTWTKDRQATMSQDDLVRLLISGEQK